MEQSEIRQFNKLIREMAHNNERSLEVFYEKFGRLIYSAAISVTRSSYLADEVVDDVLTKIWLTSRELPAIKTPAAWLYRITVNRAKDRLKSEVRVVRVSDEVTENRMDDVLDSDEFYRSISFLSEIEQQILIFRFIEDMPFKVIAHELKKPLSSISAIYYRAIEKIKKNKLK